MTISKVVSFHMLNGVCFEWRNAIHTTTPLEVLGFLHTSKWMCANLMGQLETVEYDGHLNLESNSVGSQDMCMELWWDCDRFED